TINDDNTIVVTFPFGTDITALTPTIGIPEFATVNPTAVQDFSTPITYTVTAEDGSTATYTVSVTVNAPSPFITTWKTTSDNEDITIYINPNITTGYDYQINWGDGSTENNLTGDATHQYASAGTYTVEISGDFPAILSYGNTNAEKLQTIEGWGDIAWESMTLAFAYCTNLTYNATDVPNLDNVTRLEGMFISSPNFNGDISNWDVSKVTNMAIMFYNATAFNADLSSWDVSEVTNMSNMFSNASSFNGDINSWDVSKVTNMEAMFFGASNFNGDLSNWDVSKVTTMYGMFNNATTFSQDLSNWATDNVTACAYFDTGSALTPAQLPTAGCFQP
ncbi:BspA family leucine-rich repeat surface protein, partial [Flavivirga jejuensis]